jgi:chlorocatechol 1,2-dioxygenase
MNERLSKIVTELVGAISKVLVDNQVTRQEYRNGVHYIDKTAAEGEIMLICDTFLEHLVIKGEDSRGQNSSQAVQGPFFIADVPWVDGKLEVSPEDNGEPLLIKGSVSAPDGTPVTDATVHVWHSTPDGAYTGFHRGMTPERYRGRLKTDASGKFEVLTTLPVPYSIPDKGPVGTLLAMMDRHPWRPAHVHFKVLKGGFTEFTTQAYFEGGEWVDDDVAGGVVDDLIFPIPLEGDKRILKVDFVLDPAKDAAAVE